MKQTLIYGTTNPAKLKTMQKNLSLLPLEIVGLEEYKGILPDVDESGNNPLENARIKALAYFRTIGKLVFSCDSGLFFDGIPAEEQPGVHVRNVGGKRLNDEEMIAYYSALSAKHGGKLVAKYKNAICLVMSEDKIYEYTGGDLAGDIFYIVSEPHQKRVKGFPLDCLSVHIETGKYYYDLDDIISGESMKGGFTAFFERTVCKKATEDELWDVYDSPQSYRKNSPSQRCKKFEQRTFH